MLGNIRITDEYLRHLVEQLLHNLVAGAPVPKQVLHLRFIRSDAPGYQVGV